MLGSYKLFRQIAQVSVQMAQLHIATAFHFLISNLLPPDLVLGFFSGTLVDGPAESMSMATMSVIMAN